MAQLQLYSFNINEENIDDVYLKIFKLPSEVKEVMNELKEDNSKGDNIAGSTIFKIAATLFDEVIYANKKIYDINKDDGIWFYSIGEFELETLKIKVIQWLKEEYKNRTGKELNKRFTEKWKFDGEIYLKQIIKRNNGCKFTLIPNYYVYKLSKNIFKFDSIQRNLKFYRTIEDNNTILLSKPMQLENKLYTPFSYYIICRMKNPIDVDNYVINFYLKVRVWTDYNLLSEKGINYLDGKEATSIFIYKENEYYNSDDILFNRVQINKDNKSMFTIKDACDNNYIKLLDIDIEDILRNVSEYSQDNDKLMALITNKNKQNVNTQSGAGLPERNEMLKKIQEMLPELELRKSIESISTSGPSKTDKVGEDLREYYDLEDDISKNTIINKERYIMNKNIDKIILNVYTNNTTLYNRVKKLFSMYLRLENNLILDKISPDGYNVEINMVNNDFTREFSESEDKEERKSEINNLIENYDKKTLSLALIDISAYHNKKETKDRDPKNLVRVAFKDSRVLTQFINYTEDTKINVIMNAIKDLISAAGFVEASLYKNIGLEKDDILVGIGKVSGGNNEKILAMSKIDKGKIYINLYGINKWMELNDCIFSINKNFINKINISKNGITTAKGIEQWILDNLYKILENNRKVYTFIDTDIRSGLWDKIKNEKFNELMLSKLRLLNKDLLRMIRINDTDEVPEYFIYDNKDNINKKNGVFKGEKNTYYLVGMRQDTDQVAVSTTKCACPNKPLKRPSMYEVNVIGFNNENEKDKIAIMTQELRRMNISYDKHTSLPLPLYTIKRLSEYIIAEKKF